MKSSAITLNKTHIPEVTTSAVTLFLLFSSKTSCLSSIGGIHNRCSRSALPENEVIHIFHCRTRRANTREPRHSAPSLIEPRPIGPRAMGPSVRLIELGTSCGCAFSFSASALLIGPFDNKKWAQSYSGGCRICSVLANSLADLAINYVLYYIGTKGPEPIACGKFFLLMFTSIFIVYVSNYCCLWRP